MKSWFRIPTLGPLCLIAGLSACAVPPPPAPEAVTPFPRIAARETLAAGFGRVVERYLEPLTVEAVALEGMHGVGVIDPSLTVRRDGDQLVVSVDAQIVGTFKAPLANDVGSWAAVTVDIVAAGRRYSRELRAADAEQIYQAVFDGALSNLDIYSRYAGAEEARELRAKREGFGGIGISYVLEDGALRVTRIMSDTPAEAGNLREDDRIVAIDRVSTKDMSVRDVRESLRGPVGTSLMVSVVRAKGGEAEDLTLERAHIVPNTVSIQRDGDLLHIRIGSFNQSTAAALAAQLKEIADRAANPPKGLILDLRGNPGGLLKQSIRVADQFLTRGDIVNTRGRHPDSVQHYDAGGDDVLGDNPMVILIDGRSASAAEIVAAALQDHGRAILVGTSSFGKGTVQTVIRTPNDGEITLTWSRLFAPSGYVLQGLGVRPQVCTSGFRDGDDDAIARVLANGADTSRDLDRWRRSTVEEGPSRGSLRDTCPAERRRQGLDVAMAKRLLSDPGLYADVLDLSSSVAAAPRPLP